MKPAPYRSKPGRKPRQVAALTDEFVKQLPIKASEYAVHDRGSGLVVRVTTPAKVRTAPGRPKKAQAGNKLPQKEFRAPLLLALNSLGGSASLREVQKAIYPRLKEKLGQADYNVVATGEPRWWNAVCWERNSLVKEGYFRSDSERGRWELSTQGKELANTLNGASNDRITAQGDIQ